MPRGAGKRSYPAIPTNFSAVTVIAEQGVLRERFSWRNAHRLGAGEGIRTHRTCCAWLRGHRMIVTGQASLVGQSDSHFFPIACLTLNSFGLHHRMMPGSISVVRTAPLDTHDIHRRGFKSAPETRPWGTSDLEGHISSLRCTITRCIGRCLKRGTCVVAQTRRKTRGRCFVSHVRPPCRVCKSYWVDATLLKLEKRILNPLWNARGLCSSPSPTSEGNSRHGSGLQSSPQARP
jgi:hypothetical protein